MDGKLQETWKQVESLEHELGGCQTELADVKEGRDRLDEKASNHAEEIRLWQEKHRMALAKVEPREMEDGYVLLLEAACRGWQTWAAKAKVSLDEREEKLHRVEEQRDRAEDQAQSLRANHDNCAAKLARVQAQLDRVKAGARVGHGWDDW